MRTFVTLLQIWGIISVAVALMVAAVVALIAFEHRTRP